MPTPSPLPQQLLIPQRPIVLGVAGCSGSGKTTLARELTRLFAAHLLPLDLYYRDLSHIPVAERASRNFDHPDSIEVSLLLEQLTALIAGRTIDRPVYDFTTHTRVSNRTDLVQPTSVLIVEGILALHYPELRALYDISIFVEAPEQVCLGRRVHRDIRERGRTEQSVREQFRTLTKPMAEEFVLPSARFASLCVDGTESLDWSVAAVLHTVGTTLARRGLPAGALAPSRRPPGSN